MIDMMTFSKSVRDADVVQRLRMIADHIESGDLAVAEFEVDASGRYDLDVWQYEPENPIHLVSGFGSRELTLKFHPTLKVGR